MQAAAAEASQAVAAAERAAEELLRGEEESASSSQQMKKRSDARKARKQQREQVGCCAACAGPQPGQSTPADCARHSAPGLTAFAQGVSCIVVCRLQVIESDLAQDTTSKLAVWQAGRAEQARSDAAEPDKAQLEAEGDSKPRPRKAPGPPAGQLPASADLKPALLEPGADSAGCSAGQDMPREQHKAAVTGPEQMRREVYPTAPRSVRALPARLGHAEDVECAVCWDAVAGIVFQPCGQAVTCMICAPLFLAGDAACPMCRAVITSGVAFGA